MELTSEWTNIQCIFVIVKQPRTVLWHSCIKNQFMWCVPGTLKKCMLFTFVKINSYNMGEFLASHWYKANVIYCSLPFRGLIFSARLYNFCNSVVIDTLYVLHLYSIVFVQFFQHWLTHWPPLTRYLIIYFVSHVTDHWPVN